MTEIAGEWREPRRASRIGRFARWLVRSVTISFVVFLIGYLWFAIPFWFGKPIISRRFVADYNRSVQALPPDQTAWQILADAALEPRIQVAGDPWQEGIRATTPDDPLWNSFVVAVEQNRPRLELAKRASLKPRLGYQLSDSADPAFNKDLPIADRRGSVRSIDPAANPLVIDCQLPTLGAMRGLARELAAEIRVAAEKADAPRLVDDVQTIFRLAELTIDPPQLICQLVGIALTSLATREIEWTIAAYPGLLDDADLACLSQDLLRMRALWSRLDLRWERDNLFDIVQRWFTDDGAGDGKLSLAGLAEWKQNNRQSTSWRDYFGGPITSQRFGTRKQILTLVDQVIDGAEVDGTEPVWQRISWRCKDAIDGPNADVGFGGAVIVGIVMPAIRKAVGSIQSIQSSIDATRFVIEIERFRLRFDRYPRSVQELRQAGFAGPPSDIFDGKPLRYLFRGNETPLVYSVGPDRVDDGGMSPSYENSANELLTELEFKELSADEKQRRFGDLVYWPPAEVNWIDGSPHPFQVRRPATRSAK